MHMTLMAVRGLSGASEAQREPGCGALATNASTIVRLSDLTPLLCSKVHACHSRSYPFIVHVQTMYIGRHYGCRAEA